MALVISLAIGAVGLVIAGICDPSITGLWVKCSAACVLGLVGIARLIRGDGA